MSKLSDSDRQSLLSPKKQRSGKIDKAAKISRAFASLNRKFEEQQTQRRAKKIQLPYFDMVGFPIDERALGVVSKQQAHGVNATVFFREGSLLKIGTTDASSPDLKKLLQSLKKKKYEIELYLVSASGLKEAHEQYSKIFEAPPAKKHEVDIELGEKVVAQFKALKTLGERISSYSMSGIISLIIGSAVSMKASDIHLEPEKNVIKIRFRIDGVLQDIISLPKLVSHRLLSRIKLLASLKLNVTATPQDGSFTVESKDGHLDIRVSVLPSAFGESVVMRILGIQDFTADLEGLGLQRRDLELVKTELKKPNGMILTTGPTGSGKTTTLYAFLGHLNRPGVKIITLEDPVEYQVEGVIQTPIKASAGMDFAKGLRSILRQDPDIVMVGEIRDFETAETASQAALTGHVVLSTMHTNDAAGAIPRFLDLGVKPVTLAPALNLLIAQRLLRRVCNECKESYKPSKQEIDRVKLALSQIPPESQVKVQDQLMFYHSAGCEICHHLGYSGRIGVFEVFAINDSIEQLIFKQASTNEIKKAAISAGMITMQQDGILKALQGLTDLAEVWRATEE